MSGERDHGVGRVAQSLGILTLLVLLVGLGWFLGFYYSCYGYELEEWQDFSVGYHPETGRAFLGVYHWGFGSLSEIGWGTHGVPPAVPRTASPVALS